MVPQQPPPPAAPTKQSHLPIRPTPLHTSWCTFHHNSTFHGQKRESPAKTHPSPYARRGRKPWGATPFSIPNHRKIHTQESWSPHNFDHHRLIRPQRQHPPCRRPVAVHVRVHHQPPPLGLGLPPLPRHVQQHLKPIAPHIAQNPIPLSHFRHIPPHRAQLPSASASAVPCTGSASTPHPPSPPPHSPAHDPQSSAATESPS